MRRRDLLASLAAAPLASAQRRERPNIVFVLSDDHSAPYLGCYGDPAVRTPNIDQFASEGMRFDRAFTAAPQCVPSRTAFLTGRSPVAARVGRFSTPLAPDVITGPELLRASGYYTGILGRGFHLDGPGAAQPLSKLLDDMGMKTFARRVDYLDPGSGRPQRRAKIKEFFDGRPADKPFFLWANFSDPHHVWDAPPADASKLRWPKHLPDLPGMREDLAKYCGEITRMDEEFQWVVDALKERKAYDNTLFVFMGDNGMALPHGKGSLYDPGLNVPMIARWPGRIRAGSSNNALVSGEDITPTLLDAAGLSPAKGMSGQSFLKLATGEQQAHRQHIFAARIHHGNAPFTEKTRADQFDLSRCARSQSHKLIYNCTPQMEYAPVDSARDAGWREIVAAHQAGKLSAEHERAYFTRPRPVIELYDLEKDPSELNSVAGRPEYASVELELKKALTEKMIRDYDFLPPPM